jgi:hypothetical protein
MEIDAAVLKSLQPWMYGVTARKGADAEALNTALAELAAARPRNNVSTTDMPIRGLQVWHYEDPASAATAQLKLLQTLDAGSTFQFTALKEKPQIKAGAWTHRDFKLHHVKFVWDLEKLGARIPGGGAGAAEAMKKVLGEDLNVWFGTDGKTYVQVAAKDRKEAQRMLDAYLDGKDSLGTQQAFLDTRKHLPARTTMIVLIDLPRYAQFFMNIMKAQAGQEAGQPAEKTKPSYLGLAITLRSEVGSFDLWVPGSAIGEIGKGYFTLRAGQEK